MRCALIAFIALAALVSPSYAQQSKQPHEKPANRPTESVSPTSGAKPTLPRTVSQTLNPPTIARRIARSNYLHSLIGYASPCDTPMKTLLPPLQRLMQVLTSALHLALNVAPVRPDRRPNYDIRHPAACRIRQMLRLSSTR